MGPREEFKVLFNKYIDEVVSFLFVYTSNKALVKDWAQDVFIKMWDKREDIDFNHPAFKSYLLKTARNHALKKLKQENNYDTWLEENLEKLTKDNSVQEPVINAPDIKEAYKVARTKISRRARKAYLLSREEGLTYSEIAEVMGISIKTVETHISKALEILREELKEFSRNNS